VSEHRVSGRSRRIHRTSTALAAGALAGLLLLPATALAAEETITFASDATWTASDADSGVGPSLSLPAPAQFVCLNDSFPVPCPAGATKYGWPGGGWTADLSAIPGAAFIWAPGISGATEPADLDAYEFAKTIDVPGTPTAGTVSVAADDGASVWVNGTNVVSTTSPDGVPATVDITANLVEGENTIVVRAQNGPICGRVCTYTENPGGVVFGGSISYEPAAVDPGPVDPEPVPTTPPTATASVQARDGGTGPAPLVLVGALALVGLAFVGVRPGRRLPRD
jgi:hypothetical protein